MTTLTIERLGRPEPVRTQRLREQWTDAELSGRAIWCVGIDDRGRLWAEPLDAWLRGTAGQPATRPLELDPEGPPRDLSEQLDALLFGDAGPAHALRPGDIVVAHDAISAHLADAARDRGAHVAWRLGRAVPVHVRPAIDAYLTCRPGPDVARVSAVMPSAGVLAAREVPAGTPWRPAWHTVLAQLVHADRAESVGGRRGPRPGVAPR